MTTTTTTVTVPAVKGTGYRSYSDRKPDVTVTIAGVANGYGKTLGEAKDSAVASLIELATIQQSAPAGTVTTDDTGTLLKVFYPHGTGTDAINIRVSRDGSMRRTCSSSMLGTPADNADRDAQQPDTERIF